MNEEYGYIFSTTMNVIESLLSHFTDTYSNAGSLYTDMLGHAGEDHVSFGEVVEDLLWESRGGF